MKTKESLLKKLKQQNKGVTLIALVITVIVLIILAGVSINLIFNQSGIIIKSKQAKEESLKQTATEVMNLKITNIQISNYTENETLPSLQFLANKLCEDNDMEYVVTQSRTHASLDKIDVTNSSSIYTKLKKYPYEFEINSSLQLASIDGVKISDNNKDESVTLTKEQYDSILNRLKTLEDKTNRNENYSTEEQVVGKWIDGKPLYRKVVKLVDGELKTKTLYKYPIDNIDYSYTIDYWYTRVSGNNDSSTEIHNGYYFSNEYVNMFIINAGIYFDGALDYYTIKDLWAIVEYTKTTD